MRPEKFDTEMSKAFEIYFSQGDNSRFISLLKEMKRQWKKYAAKENDFRTGTETYDYRSEDDVYLNMQYISDRWKCAYRLKWLIDGLDLGVI